MTPRQKNGGLRVMVICSAVLHIIAYFFLLEFHFPAHFKAAPVYYVDVVNLPVANPQAGTPSGGGSPSPPPPSPSPPAAPPPREMTLPAKAPARPAPLQKKAEAPETAREFEQRIARLEREAAARHEADALKNLSEAMRKKGARGPIGMPGATGTEAGSDYTSYIRSRLEDAFRKEDTFKPDPSKTVIVRLTIDQNGRIIGLRYEQRSSDRMFNDAVDRAISRAEKDFKRPPGGGRFENGFVFKPQGVGKK